MMVYIIFLYMLLLFDIRGESHENVTLYWYSYKVWLSFKVWFRRYRWKELSVTYLHTFILSYLLTDQPSHRVSYKLTKKYKYRCFCVLNINKTCFFYGIWICELNKNIVFLFLGTFWHIWRIFRSKKIYSFHFKTKIIKQKCPPILYW